MSLTVSSIYSNSLTVIIRLVVRIHNQLLRHFSAGTYESMHAHTRAHTHTFSSEQFDNG